MYRSLALFCCLFLSLTTTSNADEAWITGDVKARLYFEDVTSYSQDDGLIPVVDQKVSTTFLELYPEFQLNFSDNFSLNTSWQLLVLKDSEGDDRFFEDEGIVLNEFYINYDDEQASFFFGKFNPKFGYAWDLSLDSGIWGNNLSEEYRLVGKLGLGFAAKFDFEGAGKHRIELATFYDDTTSMNDSMLTRRDRSESGVGDMSATESLSSYTLNLYGSNLSFYPDLFYNLSYRNLEGTSESLVGQEDGFSVGVGADVKVFTTLGIRPYIEYAKINGFNSYNNRFSLEFNDDNFIPGDAEYLTLYIPFEYGRWHISYLYSERDTDSNVTANNIGKLTTEETSISFNVLDSVSITMGRKEDVLSGSHKSQSAGFMTQYSYSF